MVYSIQDFLYQLEAVGVYDYLLPFLLIFAVVYGILSYMKIFGNNKGISVIVAFVIGLLAINTRWGFDFGQFYTQIFPRLGIGITVILAVMILVGMFIPEDDRRYWAWGLSALGGLIAIIILYKSFAFLGWDVTGYGGGYAVGWIAGAILIIGLIIAIASSGQEQKPKQPSAFIAPFWGDRSGKPG